MTQSTPSLNTQKVPASLLTSNSTLDPLVNMIRTAQYGRTRSENNSQEDSNMAIRRIFTDGEICRAVCNLKEVHESVDKMELRLLNEVRKVNRRLINFEENIIKNLTSRFEEIMKAGVDSMKRDILNILREN